MGPTGDNLNVVSLLKYVEDKFADLKDVVKSKENMMEKRLDGMNEFRETLRDQSSTMLTRHEFMIMYEKIINDISDLKHDRDVAQGKASQLAVNITFLLALISLLVSIFSLWMKI